MLPHAATLASALAAPVAQSQDNQGIFAVFALFFTGMGLLFSLLYIVLLVAGMWKLYAKAGEPGWAAIIPLYNVWVLLRIVGRPQLLWFILLLIPFVNIVVSIILMVDLAKSFGRGLGFALGLIFLAPIFMIILGFGESRYLGPAAAMAQPQAAV